MSKNKKIEEFKKRLGRPSKYTPEILEKAIEYLVDFDKNNQYDPKKPYKTREAAPSILGLAKYIGIHRDTVYTWSKEEGKEDFSDIVKEIESERELSLINKALFKEIDGQITKLLLSQVGIIEKKEIKQDINVFDGMSDDELRKLAGED